MTPEQFKQELEIRLRATLGDNPTYDDQTFRLTRQVVVGFVNELIDAAELPQGVGYKFVAEEMCKACKTGAKLVFGEPPHFHAAADDLWPCGANDLWRSLQSLRIDYQ